MRRGWRLGLWALLMACGAEVPHPTGSGTASASSPSPLSAPRGFPLREPPVGRTLRDLRPPSLNTSGPAAVLAACREVRQNIVQLGRLQRPDTLHGELVFAHDPAEALHLWFHFTGHMPGDARRAAVPVVAFTSLVAALRLLPPAQRNATVLHVLAHNLTDGEPWADWLEASVEDHVRHVAIAADCPAEAEGAVRCALRRISAFPDPRAVMLLLEDNYVSHPEMVRDVAQLFASHDICLAVPYDAGDSYPETEVVDSGHFRVIAGLRRHWRTTDRVTASFAVRAEVLEAVGPILHAPWPRDGPAGALRAKGVEIWGPLPSLASYVAPDLQFSERQAPYFDFLRFARRLLQQTRRRPPPLKGWDQVVKALVQAARTTPPGTSAPGKP